MGTLVFCFSQIGQIMLTLPNAVSKTGIVSGLVWGISVAILALWTMYLLSALYLERKAALVSMLLYILGFHR